MATLYDFNKSTISRTDGVKLFRATLSESVSVVRKKVTYTLNKKKPPQSKETDCDEMSELDSYITGEVKTQSGLNVNINYDISDGAPNGNYSIKIEIDGLPDITGEEYLGLKD